MGKKGAGVASEGLLLIFISLMKMWRKDSFLLRRENMLGISRAREMVAFISLSLLMVIFSREKKKGGRPFRAPMEIVW